MSSKASPEQTTGQDAAPPRGGNGETVSHATPQGKEETTITSVPSKAGKKGTIDLRTSNKRKAEIHRSFVELMDKGTSLPDIQRLLDLTDSQLHTCVKRWSFASLGQHSRKIAVKASRLPQDAFDVLGLHYEDMVLLEVPDADDKGSYTIVRAVNSDRH